MKCLEFNAHLDETNGVRLLPEALSADVEIVLSDDTTLVTANSALAGALSVLSWVACKVRREIEVST